MKKYIFVGNGACVPGLPREISETEISQMNEAQFEVWNAALSSGQYQEVGTGLSSPKLRKTKSSKQSASPDEGE